MSGKKAMLLVGGAFIVGIVVFYLIRNWDLLGNLFLHWGQNIMGIDEAEHFHFPMSVKNAGAFDCAGMPDTTAAG